MTCLPFVPNWRKYFNFSRCEVELENYSRRYFMGETLVGRLKCIITRNIRVLGIYIEIAGVAETRWTKRKLRFNLVTRSVRCKTIVYYGVETLLKHHIQLVRGERYIEQGTYFYAFEYKIPKDLPTSFKSRRGRIRYVLSGVIERNLPVLDYRSSYEITVLCKFAPSNEQRPLFAATTKVICGVHLRLSTVTFCVRLPRSAFRPAQKFLVDVIVRCSNGRAAHTVRFYVAQTVMCVAHYPVYASKTGTENVCRLYAISNEYVDSVTYRYCLRIPYNFKPRRIREDSLITFEYVFRAELSFQNYSTKVFLELPVTIGY